MINHFDFVERLISTFLFFDISLERIAKQSNCNLFIFNKYKHEIETNDSQGIVLPKFDSPQTDECLIKVMHHLSHKLKLINPNSDVWLFWFDRKPLKTTEFLIWDDSPTLLSKYVGIKILIRTKNKYERSRMYKEIEQIITISMKKNS